MMLQPTDQVAQALVGEAVDVDVPLATQGLDSLAAMELRQKLQACRQLVRLKQDCGRLHTGTGMRRHCLLSTGKISYILTEISTLARPGADLARATTIDES